MGLALVVNMDSARKTDDSGDSGKDGSSVGSRTPSSPAAQDHAIRGAYTVYHGRETHGDPKACGPGRSAHSRKVRKENDIDE